MLPNGVAGAQTHRVDDAAASAPVVWSPQIGPARKKITEMRRLHLETAFGQTRWLRPRRRAT